MSHHMHPYMRNERMRQMADERYERELHKHEREEAPRKDTAEGEKPVHAEEESLAGEEASSRGASEAAEPSVDEKKELDELRLRMAAEMDNFKKRLAREHQEQMRYASEKVLSALLPALDNLDLAIEHGIHDEACGSLLEGIEMTRRQLLDAVAKSGLAPLGSEGEPFDPAIHEAIGMARRPDLEKGAVARVLQRGYKLNDRLLRPAKVMVNG